MPPISPESLRLLRNCLVAQQLSVGDPDFLAMAQAAATALTEVDVLLESAGG